jgi:hypothetical protein
MDDWFRKIISIQRQQNTGIAPGRPRTPGPNAVPRSGRDESEPSNPFKLVEANLKSASRSREEHVIEKESLKSEELERGPTGRHNFRGARGFKRRQGLPVLVLLHSRRGAPAAGDRLAHV